MEDDQSRPDFTGVWSVNVEKSTMRGQSPKILMKIEHREPTVIQQMYVEYANGQTVRLNFVYKTTGEETSHPVSGGIGKSRAHWDGTELVIESSMRTPDREFHFRDHWSLSSDRQTLTMAHRNDDLDGQISVLEKAPKWGKNLIISRSQANPPVPGRPNAEQGERAHWVSASLFFLMMTPHELTKLRDELVKLRDECMQPGRALSGHKKGSVDMAGVVVLTHAIRFLDSRIKGKRYIHTCQD